MQTLMCFDEQHLREAGSVTPTAHVNAGRPRTVRTPGNEDAMIAVVEWSLCNILRELGLSQPKVLEVFREDKMHVFPGGRPLRMAIC
jgi:hypothetical protein